MATPQLLQIDPDRFRVMLGDGVERVAHLSAATRRDLGLVGVPPLQVATEAVGWLMEQGALPAGEFDLVRLAAKHPMFIEELTARLA